MSSKLRGFILKKNSWWLLLSVWVILIALSLAANLASLDHTRQEAVSQRARLIFEMAKALHIAKAEAHTPDSRALPLRDDRTTPITTDIPAGAARERPPPSHTTQPLIDAVNDIAGLQIHLFGVSPSTRDSTPAAWESAPLRLFSEKRNITEWSDYADEHGTKQFRYIAPLFAAPLCFSCHEQQGATAGDLFGAMSVVLPTAQVTSAFDRQARNTIVSHLGLLVLLIALTLVLMKYLRRQHSLHEAKRLAQVQLMEQRTAELRYEAERHQLTENKLRSIIEFSGEGIFVIDQQGRFTLCNPAALRILGYPDEASMLGRSVHALLCPTAASDGVTLAQQCGDCAIYHSYSTGSAQHKEAARFRCANGTTIPVEYRSQPLLNGTERMGAVITFADISARLSREQQLHKLSKALEYSPVAAMITDHQGHIEYVNRRFVETSGYLAEEVLGSTPGLLKSGQTPSATYEAMWEQLSRGEPWYGEFLNRKKSGELFWDDTAIAPITDKSGRVINYVAFKEDITRRKEAERLVWQQANYDSLTGLPNRYHFQDQLKHNVRAARRYNRKFALMFLDLDGFKKINDTLGHDVGDELLRHTAQRLRDCTRGSDIVSRLGGDEFTVIIPVFDSLDDIEQVVQKIVEGISQPYRIREHEIRVSTSLGVATYPADAADCTTLAKMADIAMYAAKHRGKNRFIFYANLSSGASRLSGA